MESTREKIRKETKQPGLDFCRDVDAQSKALHEIFEPMKTKYALARKSIDDYEKEIEQNRINEERERVEAIGTAITHLRELPLTIMGRTASQVEEVYSSIPTPSEEVFQERLDEALNVYRDSMGKLEDQILAMRKSEEADKIIAEQVEAQRMKDAAREQKEKAEREEFEKEKAELARERAELDREKNAKIEAENLARVEAEAEELAEQQERETLEMEQSEKIAKEGNYQKTLEDMSKFNSNESLLDAIIHGLVRGVSYE